MEELSLIPQYLAADPKAILALILGYFFGSIPFGLIITKTFLGFDVREQGSGNIGMTNVMRTAGKLPGIATFLLDFSKGLLAVMIAHVALRQPDAILAAVAFCAVFGHTRSMFLKFTGGKGVATHFGVWAWLDWRVFVITAGAWALFFAWKKISSLSALVSLLILPLVTWQLHGNQAEFAISLLLAFYIIVLHRSNIQRLLQGEEGKLTSKDT